MPERIPELDALAAAAKETDMLPPSEIRRRGDRRRRGRYLATGAGAAALAIIAAVAVGQSPLLDDRREPDWATPAPAPTSSPTEEAPTPSPSEPPTTPDPTPAAPAVDPPTWANVPVFQELVSYEAPDVVNQDFETDDPTAEYGVGEWSLGGCVPNDWGKPTKMLLRSYTAAEGEDTGLMSFVLAYPSVEAATEGFDKLKAGVIGCLDLRREQDLPVSDQGRFTDASDEIVLDKSIVDVEPVRVSYSYGFYTVENDSGSWNETTLVQAGDRVLWVVSEFFGQDFNCSVAPEPDIQQCERPAALPALLTRLAG